VARPDTYNNIQSDHHLQLPSCPANQGYCFHRIALFRTTDILRREAAAAGVAVAAAVEASAAAALAPPEDCGILQDMRKKLKCSTLSNSYKAEGSLQDRVA